MKKVVKKLTDIDFLTDHFVNGNIQYSGVCHLNSKSLARRIDMKIFPYDNFYPALLHFTGTFPPLCLPQSSRGLHDARPSQPFCLPPLMLLLGSGEFIRQLSMMAINKGFKLNEYQLVPVGITGVEGAPIPLNSEQEIFDMLGLKYRDPTQRSMGGTHLNKNRNM